MPNETDLVSGVNALLGLTEEELQTELGLRLALTSLEIKDNEPLTAARAIGFNVDQQVLQSRPSYAENLGRRFLDKFNAQMYSLICDEANSDNAKFRESLTEGTAALSYAISGALVTTFGWLPGIATVIAVIIAKQAAQAGFMLFCEAWKERLS